MDRATPMQPALVPTLGRQRDRRRQSDPPPPAPRGPATTPPREGGTQTAPPPNAGLPWTHGPAHEQAHDLDPGTGGKRPGRPPPP